jgi:renalase
MTSQRVVGIVGGGLSGLCAARVLQRYCKVILFEKEQEIGGRMKTIVRGDAVWDVGAMFFTTRNEEFRNEVESWVSSGEIKMNHFILMPYLLFV